MRGARWVHIETRIALESAAEQTIISLFCRLLPKQVMNLLVIRHVVLGKYILDLLEVPVRYTTRDVLNFFGRPAHMPVKAVRSGDAEAVSIIVAFTV